MAFISNIRGLTFVYLVINTYPSFLIEKMMPINDGQLPVSKKNEINFPSNHLHEIMQVFLMGY